MSRAHRVAAIALTMGIACAAGPIPSPGQVFRSRVDLVSVDVSVMDGRRVVAGLRAGDFRLYDNGVLQSVDAIAVEAVPIDVTIFHDTSPSQGGRIDALKRDVVAIAGLLRPDDRLRLLTFDNQVQDAFGWQPAGSTPDVSRVTLGRISPVYDALFSALLHRPAAGRRHLVLALTDARDAGSVVPLETLALVADRSEGVIHLVLLGVSGRPGLSMRGAIRQWNPTLPVRSELDRVRKLTADTGGVVHDEPLFRNHVVSSFTKAFDDFRQSYVLRYTPTGVAPGGWHELKVEIVKPGRYTVRARRGYR